MKVYMNWSGGKDSALALYHSKKNGPHIGCLSTNINATYNRISMHGVRTSLLEEQAAAVGLPLYKMELPEQPDMKLFEERTNNHVKLLKEAGYTDAVFGDIFLEDLKQYRETQLKPLGIRCHFPLWERNTVELIDEFISLGFKAIVVCVNSHYLDQSFCGRIIDRDFIKDLPSNVDPCGENGEYHSFVFDGPLFDHPVRFTKGDIITRNYTAPKQDSTDCFTQPSSQIAFHFCELLPCT